jgi:hypothetical protein
MKKDYYSNGKIECIDVVEQLYEEHTNDAFIDYNRFQAFKYLWRLGKKDDVLKELQKAKAFIEFAIKRAQKLND